MLFLVRCAYDDAVHLVASITLKHHFCIIPVAPSSEEQSKNTVDDDKKSRKKPGNTVVQVEESRPFSFLRTIYSVNAAFMGGFVFIFGFDILQSEIVNLNTSVDTYFFHRNAPGSQAINIPDFIASLLSVPVVVYSMAVEMALLTQFVVDIFYGRNLLHMFGFGPASCEWMAFVFYSGVPFLAILIARTKENADWWELTLLTWLSSALIFWKIYCVFVFASKYKNKKQENTKFEEQQKDRLIWFRVFAEIIPFLFYLFPL